jgi:hypothetical protein
MEIELGDVTGLPEALKSLAVASGDKFKLDLSKLMPSEDLTGLKGALQRERETAGAYSKYGKPADIAAKFAALEEAASGGGKGGADAQAKLDAMKAGHDAERTADKARFTKLISANARAELKAALAQAGVIPEGLDMLAQFAASRLLFDDEGAVRVVTSEGKPMIGSGADHGATLADLAKELAGSMPYLVKDGGAGGGGKPPGSATKTGPTMKMADFNAKPAKERAALMASGLSLTD